ncbi:MAG: UDP-N-acetylmuramate dehydrogenase [Clostridia bacterium]|nr:UDP-N-acetylmuramate dehydrogenase [Clostridia bacterium]
MNNTNEMLVLAQELGCVAKVNEPMSLHTTFRIGGKAKLFIKVNSKSSFRALLMKAKDLGQRVILIGNGSNMLVTDDDIDAVFFQLGGGEFDEIKLIDDTTIYCGAGVSLAKLCNFAYENSLTGLEFAYGIPACVGGAIFMNSGAYGGEMSDVVVSASHVTACGEYETLSADKLDFSYRHSAYKSNGCFVTDVVIRLGKGDKQEIDAKMKDFMSRRRDKQPLEYPSAGSTFKRPVGYFAAKLIDDCKLKGFTVGGAQVSEKHAGFVVNKGGATCADVLELMKNVSDKVFDTFGVRIEPEIIYVPYK